MGKLKRGPQPWYPNVSKVWWHMGDLLWLSDAACSTACIYVNHRWLTDQATIREYHFAILEVKVCRGNVVAARVFLKQRAACLAVRFECI